MNFRFQSKFLGVRQPSLLIFPYFLSTGERSFSIGPHTRYVSLKAALLRKFLFASSPLFLLSLPPLPPPFSSFMKIILASFILTLASSCLVCLRTPQHFVGGHHLPSAVCKLADHTEGRASDRCGGGGRGPSGIEPWKGKRGAVRHTLVVATSSDDDDSSSSHLNDNDNENENAGADDGVWEGNNIGNDSTVVDNLVGDVDNDSGSDNPFISSVQVYKDYISPLLPKACRFTPTCSSYSIAAIEEFGNAKGLVLTAWRIARCNPLGGRGYDPPQWPPVPFNYARSVARACVSVCV